MKIKEEQISAACEISSQVFDGQLTSAQGGEILSSEYGLNRATANDFIYDYKCLVSGKTFHRAMSAPAMRHFIEHIFSARNRQAKENAVTALRAHIVYYEGHYKVNLHAMRSVADDFATLLAKPSNLSEIEAELARTVEHSLHSSQSERLRRLASANKLPVAVCVQSTVFLRNPDVVAETLLRAEGKCESCKDNAPFLRAKDRTPYLEVHHRLPLAAGGEDSIENAIALCPNCHRRAHYGADA